ncbi:uncharacterized protein V1518DRAFT_414945 [Limtongia smithiae]|uniref:uncharacterized protein n=1 Tax=Limtongia smithiae TaxID=1125753 RepID=UPI0034CEE3D4
MAGDAYETIVSMDGLNLTAHIENTLLRLDISSPDQYIQECLSLSSSCKACISSFSGRPCGWCPFSQTCVPDPSHLGLLAPTRDSHICPFAGEQYEFRSRAFGCSVSAITLWSSVISFIVGAIIMIAIISGVAYLTRHRLLAWLQQKMQDDNVEHEDLEQKDEIYRRPLLRRHTSGYRSVISSNSEYAGESSEGEPAGDEELHSTVGYVYDPQMVPERSAVPRLHQSPRRYKPPVDLYTKYSMPDDEEGNSDHEQGLFRRLSSGVKELYFGHP